MYEYVYLCAIDPIRHVIDIPANSGSFRLTLLKAAVRGQHYQDAECKNARKLNRSTLLKLAIQLKLAMYCRGCPQSGAVEAAFKIYDLRLKKIKISKCPISVF